MSPTGATYNGDQGQRQVEIATGQTVPDSDNGTRCSRPSRTVTARSPRPHAAGNTGTGVIGATKVSNPATYAAGNGIYTINFTAADTYEVRDSANALVSTGTYADGDTISFGGVQVNLSGTPATGDSFSVAPSANQSVFTTVNGIVTALQAGATSRPRPPS